jgi:hypothetical protein
MLKRIGLVLATGLATLVVAGPAQANTNSCKAVSHDGRVSCTASVSAEQVDVARVRIGARTHRARWFLTCTKGSHTTTETGLLGVRKVARPQITLNNPECTLRASGRSRSTARVRVVLR